MDLLEKLQELKVSGTGAALCTIIQTSGSTPRKAGSKMIVTTDGKTYGSVGGGLLEKQVVKDALRCMETGKNRYMQYNSGSREDEGIYGEAGVFIEPLPVLRSLYIFGAGHVAQAVAAIAGRYGFAVHLIDPREGLLDSIITEGIQKHCMAYDEAISAFDFDDKTFIVVSTHSHASDFGVTAACSLKPHAYLGMIGSKKKVEEAREVFRNKGLPEESIDSIDMPIGMPMDCETPGEIAISILARLIDIKNK